MTVETYEKIASPFRKREGLRKSLIWGNKILTAVTYGAYLLLLLVEAFQKDPWLFRVFWVPAIAFLAVTFFRKICNAKRPYEKLQIHPILKAKKAGQSFPSRHAFSIFMIAMAVESVCVPGGILLLMLGVILAAIRVVGGVHFPRDVIAGAVVGIGIGILGFWIF